MTNENRSNMTDVWQNQPVKRVEISREALRRTAQKVERRVRWRNLREYVAGAIAIVCFGYYIWRFPAPLVRLGCVLLIAGTLFVVYALHRRGAARAVPPEMAFHTCLEFHRKELERQRDLLRNVWTWYLLPLVPGLTVFLLGLFRWTMEQPDAPAHARLITIAFGLAAAGCALALIVVGKLNHWAARKIQHEIDALDAIE